MNSKVFMALIAFFSLFIAAGARAQDFSAEMVSTEKGFGTLTARTYISDNKIRMEAGDSVTISRPDKQVFWVLIPEDRLYMEQPIQPGPAIAAERLPGETKREFLGEESVEGRKSSKFIVHYRNGRKTESVYQWIDAAMGVPLKTAAPDGSWSVLYRNIKPGRFSESLFEVPADYEKLSFSLAKPSSPGLAAADEDWHGGEVDAESDMDDQPDEGAWEERFSNKPKVPELR